jgi:hypothetical protein
VSELSSLITEAMVTDRSVLQCLNIFFVSQIVCLQVSLWFSSKNLWQKLAGIYGGSGVGVLMVNLSPDLQVQTSDISRCGQCGKGAEGTNRFRRN